MTDDEIELYSFNTINLAGGCLVNRITDILNDTYTVTVLRNERSFRDAYTIEKLIKKYNEL